MSECCYTFIITTMITPQILALCGYALISFMEGVIGLRVILKLMGASTSAPFVQWVYETSKPLLYPFEGMFPSSHVGGVPFTIEFSALFALFAYVFIGYLFQEVMDYFLRLKNQKERRESQKNKDHNE